MNSILFGVIFGSIMIYLIVDIFTQKTKSLEPLFVPVAKAGKVSDFYPRNEKINKRIPPFITVDGERINLAGYVILYVHGESMKKYKIHDKHFVFVEPVGNINSIANHPVLVFKIIDPKPGDAEYKLRKHIDLIETLDAVNWSDIYEKNKERISVSKEEFITQCTEKASKSKNELMGKVVLSETYDKSTDKDCYSLHALSTVFGIVDYAA